MCSSYRNGSQCPGLVQEPGRFVLEDVMTTDNEIKEWRTRRHSTGISFDVTLDALFECISLLDWQYQAELVLELMAHDSRVEQSAREWIESLD